MAGGRKGLLENSTDLCKGTHRAEGDFSGQNGKVSNTTPLITDSCGNKDKKGRGRGGAHHR